MTIRVKSSLEPLDWKNTWLWLAVAVACFHVAYTSVNQPVAGLVIFGYALGLVKLTDQPTVRRAFYVGLTAGLLCYAPQLYFFCNIFGPLAIALWLVLAFGVGLFAAIACGCIRRWGKVKTAWLIPFLWTGIEYFRSELYYLKFSWLNIGYALPPCLNCPGVYGVGFLVFTTIIAFFYWRTIKVTWFEAGLIIGIFLIVLALWLPTLAKSKWKLTPPLTFVGVQMEFPPEAVIPEILTQALAKNTNAPILVLSEYTLDGPVPDSLKNWCREHSRFLVVGGKDPAGTNNFYDTAFVVGTNGNIVFKQVKSVPIQFFRDGLPAPEQRVWNSPWGKIGLCVCYDLNYTHVTDELVRQGAQMLIVPTMDVEYWGRHQHELHARVAPVRAAEYGIPIFRVASSGISQAVTGSGQVIAQTSLPGNGEIFSAQLQLPMRGSLPWDRYLAPICSAITGIALVVMLMLAWNANRTNT